MTITAGTPEDFAKYGLTDLMAERESASTADAEPEKEPPPQPPKVVEPAIVQLPATANSGTMSSTSISSPGGSATGPPPAALQVDLDLLLAASSECIASSDWLFIPPPLHRRRLPSATDVVSVS